jgi:16S rRNA C1402 N4-methylase RsmH
MFMDTKQSRELAGKEKNADQPSLMMVITFHSIEERLVS